VILEIRFLKMKSTASYSTVGYSKYIFNGYLNLLKRLINQEKYQDPYNGLRIAKVLRRYLHILQVT
jgi:hypothetical protein